MDIRSMRYVLTTMKAGSFTKAARQMYLSPQALGKSIRAIEDEYGTPLFERDTRTLTPTSFGRAFAREAEKCVADFDSACIRIGGYAQQETGHFLVACAYSVPNALGYKCAGDLRKRLKAKTGMELEVAFDELPDLLAEQEMDEEICQIGLLNGAPAHEEAYDTVLLRSYPLTAVVTQDHPLAKKSSVTLADIAPYQVAAFNRHYRSFLLLKQCATAKHLDIRFAICSPDNVLWEKSVRSGAVGMGVNFLDREANAMGLVSIPFEEEEMRFLIYLARHKHAAGNKYLNALWDIIIADAKEESPCPLP